MGLFFLYYAYRVLLVRPPGYLLQHLSGLPARRTHAGSIKHGHYQIVAYGFEIFVVDIGPEAVDNSFNLVARHKRRKYLFELWATEIIGRIYLYAITPLQEMKKALSDDSRRARVVDLSPCCAPWLIHSRISASVTSRGSSLLPNSAPKKWRKASRSETIGPHRCRRFIDFG